MDEKSIFNNARKIPDPATREDYLRAKCGDDAEALKRIQELLAANADDSSFLEAPPVDVGETQSLKDDKSRIGERIGPYKLLQEIGEGGMGSVYMAEQTEPVKRRVALKIIKAGMDSKQVIARFEAERQALAMMDHPNIARLLDVGTTDSGRPYFVMELVKGVPITEYCDDKRLSVKQRLELFTSVCNAVQHAHQKGIIHRDLKPSNILVAEYDDKVVPKIIDFGLAKALSQSLTEKTVFTQFGQVVGTFAYMSPEQSKMNQLDVDTRTDIYSLGVLLYEILTGTTPFDGKRFKDAAIDQILRMIREEDPPKPSTRLSTTDSKPEIANKRNIDPRKLSILMRGDLDWIVMRAMEKDRSDRYETINGLGMDVSRYLAGEPTVAAPPSARYRLKKFLKRNRVAVVAGGLIAVALMIGLAGTSSGLFWALSEKTRAENAEKEAEKRAEESKQVSDYQAKIFEKLDAEATGEMLMHNIRGSFATTIDAMGVSDDEYRKRLDAFSEELSLVNSRQVVSWVLYQKVLKPAYDEIEPRFKDQPVVANKLRQEFAKIYRKIGNLEEALLVQEKCIEFCEREFGNKDPETISARLNKAQILVGKGEYAAAEKIMLRSVDDSKKLKVTNTDAAVTMARALRNLGQLRSRQGRYPESQSLYREAIAIYQNDLEDETGVFVAQIEMLNTLEPNDMESEAIKLGNELLPKCEQHFGPDGEITLMVKSSIARALLETLNWKAAEPLLKDVLEKRRQRNYGNYLRSTLVAEANYIRFLSKANRNDEAIQHAEQNLNRIRFVHGSKSKEYIVAINQLGLLYKETRNFHKAESCFRTVVEYFTRNSGDTATDTISSRANLAVCLHEMNKYNESERLLRQCIEHWGEEHGKKTPEYFNLHRDLAKTLFEMNDKAGAIQVLGQLFEGLDDGIFLCHLKVHTALDNYVNLLNHLGRHKKAVSVRRDVWRAMVKRPGENHPDTLRELYLLAFALERDNQLEQAEEKCQKAFLLGPDKWGHESRWTMICQRVLARVQGKLEKIDQAKKNFRANIELWRRIQGEAHWETVGTIKDFVTLLLDQDEFESAEQLRQEVVSAMKKTEANPNGNSCWELNRLGQNFESKRKYTEAEECYRLAFEIGKNAWEPESNQFMVCQRMLARIEGQVGKFETAEKRFEDSIKLQLRIRGEGHEETIETIRDYGHLFFREELYSDAKSKYGEALKLAIKAKGPTARITLSAMAGVAASLRENGELGEAENIYKEVLELSRESMGDKDPYTLAVMSNLGRILEMQDKDDKAKNLLQECLDGIGKLDDPPDWIRDYIWRAKIEMGKILVKKSQFADAEPLLIDGYQGCTNWIPSYQSPKQKSKRLQDCVKSLIMLYKSWHLAEPAGGYESKATEWSQKLEELKSSQLNSSDR